MTEEDYNNLASEVVNLEIRFNSLVAFLALLVDSLPSKQRVKDQIVLGLNDMEKDLALQPDILKNVRALVEAMPQGDSNGISAKLIREALNSNKKKV